MLKKDNVQMMEEYDKLPLSLQAREIWNNFKQQLEVYRGLRDKVVAYVQNDDYSSASNSNEILISIDETTKAMQQVTVSAQEQGESAHELNNLVLKFKI